MRLLPITSIFIFLFLFFGPRAYSQTDSTGTDKIYYLILRNGINAILMPLSTENNVEISLNIKTGSVYENDSIIGISNLLQLALREKLLRFFKSPASASLQYTMFSAYTTSELSIFKFITTNENVPACLNLIRDSIFNATLNESELMRAKDTAIRQIENIKLNPQKWFADKMLKSLYPRDNEKLSATGNPEKFSHILLSDAKKVFKRCYAPNNAIATVAGNFNQSDFQSRFSETFGELVKSEFNPESITKIIDFRPLAYTTQFIEEDSADSPEFNICWQFPGTSSNQRASYAAWLLCSMLNDKNNFIQAKAAKLGCKKFVAEFESNNFNGILRITLQPGKENFSATYQMVMRELLRLEKTIVNESMINAGKLQFRSDYNNLKNTRQYPLEIVRHWAYDNYAYFLSVSDSVMALSEKDLIYFVIDYINQNPHVSGLLISKAGQEALHLDSVFTEIDENVKNYVFHYLQNVTEPEGAENLTMLNNLVQWLKINPDVNAQVNGFSDDGEYGKVRDDTVMHFIDSLPTFRKSVIEIIKKGYMRPETMRALKIIKYLFDHGIEPARLSGTSMKFSSDNDQQAADNAKCTVSLEKLRKNMPLREYHYGKKSE